MRTSKDALLMKLSELKPGDTVRIAGLSGDSLNKKRLMALGIIKGKEITVETQAPFGDPKIYSILGYRLTMRREEAETIQVERL